ncbi:MAG: Cobyrinic acid a,c-diamide synthase [Leptospirillum sp. Group IV 'UBA BS']|nr:MAG: Cobyrinic acid a,c-diamide synthase [Leptospirillum sp. Group IV 'UBA BS']
MDVLLVDADPQGSAMKWRGLASGTFPVGVIALPMPVLDQEIPKMAKKYDLVVVDTPPGMETITRSALVVADLAIIPLQPSPLDLWSGTDIVGLIRRAQQLNPGLVTRLLLNRKIQGTRLSRESVDALKEFPFPLFKTAIHQRIALAEAVTAGKTITDFYPDGPSSSEFRALVEEIVSVGMGESP